MPASKNVSRFEEVLRALKSADTAVPTAGLYSLSDLSGQPLDTFERAWPDIPLQRRQGLIEDLIELAEANYEVDFTEIFRLAMDDEDAEVRRAGINGLWEAEDETLMGPLVERLNFDPDLEVRAAAASTLGRFVYMGEVDEIQAGQAQRLEATLLAVINGPDQAEVRRRALEALAFSSRDEVPDLIQAAYESPDQRFRVSALFAMGRSADDRWADAVLAEIENTDNELRFEAVRSAGELELERAVKPLKKLIKDPDLQIREAAIWSLGQIGGQEARKALETLLERTRDDTERDFIEEALENAAFHDDVADFALFELDEMPDFDAELDPKKKLDDRLN
ncbi:MAG: HEAT repeat domain-containing protein [Anaerolineales bacterium]|nr:HEAT repeat domain-containing protein [Anaerolineales bacterium]